MASGTAVRAGKAFVELYADESKLVRGLRNAERRLRAFGKSVTSMGKKIFQFSTAALVPFVLSAVVFANFSDQMLKVKAVTSGTTAEYEKLNEKAKELGRTTSFSSAQVASGMVELGRAGFNRKEIDLAIAGVLNLSRATDTELPEATAIAGAALRQFNLEASEMARVGDVLTATANGSAQTLTDLGEALKPVGPIASEAGESLEQVSAAIAVLANNGIRGSLAGTALARAYKNLSSDKVVGTLKGINVQAMDANKNLRPLADILADVGKATAGMGTAEKLSIFETLFGRGQAAALKLAGSGSVLNDLLSKIQNSLGIAKKTADEMDSGLGGAFRRLLSAVEGIAISIGESITPTLIIWGKQLSHVSGIITGFISENKKFVSALFVWIMKIAGVGAGLMGLGVTIQILAFAVGGLATIITGIASAIGLAVSMFGIMAAAMGVILSPLAIIIIGFSSLAISIETTTGAGSSAISGLGATIATVFGNIYSYLQETSGAFRALTSMISGSVSRIMQTFGELKETALTVFNAIRDAMSSGDFKLAAEILWGGIHLAFLQGTAPLRELWNETLYSLTDAWIVAWAGIKSGLIETSSFLQSAWQSTVTALARQIVWLWSKVDDTINVEDAYDSLNQELSNKLQAIDSARNKAQGANEKDRDDMLAGSRDVDQQRQSAVENDIADAQKKLNLSISKTAAKAKKEQAEQAVPKTPKEKELAGNFAPMSMKSSQSNAASIDARSAQGFSKLLASLNGGSQQEKKLNTIATATKRTAKATEEMASNTNYQIIPGNS